MNATDSAYPVAIVQDRYGGVYSGGEWIALSQAHLLENGTFRIVRILEGDAFGDDNDAQEFWLSPPEWIAVGDTPDQALKELTVKLGSNTLAAS